MITSVKNEKVKRLKKLHKKKERLQTSTFLIEGFHLLEEAWRSNWVIEEIIVQENIQIPNWCKAFDIEIVTENVFKHISETQTPQGIAAVIKMKEQTLDKGIFYLLIDAIQDPGNLGTIIRTADACGVDGIILGNGTVDLYFRHAFLGVGFDFFEGAFKRDKFSAEFPRGAAGVEFFGVFVDHF